MRLSMAEQIDRQHGDDDGQERDPRRDGDVDVDELGTVTSGNEIQRKTTFRLSRSHGQPKVLLPLVAGGGPGSKLPC
jgi:hypothetical protein